MNSWVGRWLNERVSELFVRLFVCLFVCLFRFYFVVFLCSVGRAFVWLLDWSSTEQIIGDSTRCMRVQMKKKGYARVDPLVVFAPERFHPALG